MRNLFVLFLILFFSSPANAIHFFNGTYQEALQKAKIENKNIFISFTASWCGPCRIMKKIVFENEKVTQYADEHYISLLLDIEFKPHMILQQRINPQAAGGIPHICIITPGEELLKENFTVNVHQMMKFLKISGNTKPIRKLLAAEELPTSSQNPRLFENRTLYENILASARKENKNMLLCFSSHFCAPCRHMEITTFQNPAIIEATNRQYITGYFETGDIKDRVLCHRYKNTQTVIPYLVIATPDEKIIRKKIGYMDSTAFMDFIHLPVNISAIDTVLPPYTINHSEKDPDWVARFFYNQSVCKWKLSFIVGANTTTLRTSGSLSDIHFNYRAGYELGFSLTHTTRNWLFAPGMSFISKGGKTNDITLRQNYLEIPIKIGWLYWNPGNSWSRSLNVAPYGAVRIGEKLRNKNDVLPDEMFKTQHLDYGLRFSANFKFSSFSLETGYNLGLHNISDYDRGKMFNRGFFMNLSMNFGR